MVIQTETHYTKSDQRLFPITDFVVYDQKISKSAEFNQ